MHVIPFSWSAHAQAVIRLIADSSDMDRRFRLPISNLAYARLYLLYLLALGCKIYLYIKPSLLCLTPQPNPQLMKMAGEDLLVGMFAIRKSARQNAWWGWLFQCYLQWVHFKYDHRYSGSLDIREFYRWTMEELKHSREDFILEDLIVDQDFREVGIGSHLLLEANKYLDWNWEGPIRTGGVFLVEIRRPRGLLPTIAEKFMNTQSTWEQYKVSDGIIGYPGSIPYEVITYWSRL